MDEKPIELSPESIDANARLLEIFSDDKRHHEATMMNTMIVFVTANGALLAGIELLAKALGAVPLGLIGVASVIVSALAVKKARFWWERVMHRGFEVQCGLRDAGVRLFAKPFGDSPASEGMGTTDLAHIIVFGFWAWYLLKHHVVNYVFNFFQP